MRKLVSPFTSLQHGTQKAGHYRELSGDNKAGVHHVGRNDDDDDDDDDEDHHNHHHHDNNDNNNNHSKFSLSTPWSNTRVEVQLHSCFVSAVDGWRMVSVTPLQLYPQARTPVPTE